LSTFNQTGLTATNSAQGYCSPDSVIAIPARRQAIQNVPGAATSVAVLIPRGAVDVIGIMFEIAPPANFSVVGGLYTVRLDVTAVDGLSDITWDQTWICRVNSGVSQGSVGSLTGQGIVFSTTGIYNMIVQGSAQPLNPGDVIEILLAFSNSDQSFNRSFVFRSDNSIDAPIAIVDSGFAGLPSIIPWKPMPTPDYARRVIKRR